jgi:hypothetical protein
MFRVSFPRKLAPLETDEPTNGRVEESPLPSLGRLDADADCELVTGAWPSEQEHVFGLGEEHSLPGCAMGFRCDEFGSTADHDSIAATIGETGVNNGRIRRAMDSTVLDDAGDPSGHRRAVDRRHPFVWCEEPDGKDLITA